MRPRYRVPLAGDDDQLRTEIARALPPQRAVVRQALDLIPYGK